MSPRPNPSEAGGTGLLLVVSFATMFVVSAECAFIALASWWLLPVIVLTVILIALVVIAAVVRTIDNGGLAGAPREREPEPEPEPSAPPVTAPLPRAVRTA